MGSKSVELIDVEDMFGADLSKPSYIPAGADGYQHRQSRIGQWHANADRFAGGVLLAEILTWYRLEIREIAFGEQYFDPLEMQDFKSTRFRCLVKALNDISSELAELFESAWYSASFDECPTLADWTRSITKVIGTDEKNTIPVVVSRDSFEAQEENIKKLIKVNIRRSQKLREQKALYGASVDPRILIEIEDIEQEIKELRAELEELQKSKL